MTDTSITIGDDSQALTIDFDAGPVASPVAVEADGESGEGQVPDPGPEPVSGFQGSLEAHWSGAGYDDELRLLVTTTGRAPEETLQRVTALASDLPMPGDVSDHLDGATPEARAGVLQWQAQVETALEGGTRLEAPPPMAPHEREQMEVDWTNAGLGDAAALLQRAWGFEYAHRIALADLAYRHVRPPRHVVQAFGTADARTWAEATAYLAEIGQRLVEGSVLADRR